MLGMQAQPLSAHLISQHRDKCKGIRKAAKKFQKDACRGPQITADDQFPEEVTYDLPCGA